MADKLGLSGSDDHVLGLRHHSERRIGSRRSRRRTRPERRRRDRRRDRLRSVILTSLAFALPLPHQLKHSANAPASNARVSTTIDSMVALSPANAYEGIIREAAALYRVDASLIRSVIAGRIGV